MTCQATRVVLPGLRLQKLTQVLHQQQGVRIDRVDMKQIVLHLANYLAKLRQV